MSQIAQKTSSNEAIEYLLADVALHAAGETRQYYSRLALRLTNRFTPGSFWSSDTDTPGMQWAQA